MIHVIKPSIMEIQDTYYKTNRLWKYMIHTVAAIKREPSLKLNICVIGQPNCIIFSVSIDTIEMQLSTKNQQDRTKIVCLGLVYNKIDFAVLRTTVLSTYYTEKRQNLFSYKPVPNK